MIRLCATSDIAEGQSKGLEIQGQRLLAVRKDGTLHVYENRCPHRGIPLEWLPDQFLDSSGSLIQCATHGALFLIDSGECVAGPCAGQALRARQFFERDGIIWLQNEQ
jgi:nitrite reductase/ring-hydroxylating ferredoxin subunit